MEWCTSLLDWLFLLNYNFPPVSVSGQTGTARAKVFLTEFNFLFLSASSYTEKVAAWKGKTGYDSN